MEVLFFWQLVGDVLKIASWIMGFVLTAKAMMGLFIGTEIIFAAFFYFLIVQLTVHYGIEAASIAHAIVYIVHWCIMFWLLKKKGLL